MSELISINEAVSSGIKRVRGPRWADPMDHLLIGVIWIKLYAPFNEECNGRDPVDIFIGDFDLDEKIYEPYTNSLPDSRKYLERRSGFKGCLAEKENGGRD